ncbi:hypothetical protein C7E17_17170 [Stenotrophomonas maltophilia]|nr:hypothetical protein C7E17_17170 [Stenotrophomonas maltophilia]
MLVYTHPSCLLHDPGPGHPECPQRLQHVLDALHTAFPGEALQYLNRLSDLCSCCPGAGRADGQGEALWQPQQRQR